MPQKTPLVLPSGRRAFALYCLLYASVTHALLLGAGGATPPHTQAAYDCEGDACTVVTLTWEEERQSFRVDNSSAQRVRVTVTTFAGESWVTVAPQKSEYLRVKSFNGPYRAEFE